MKIDPDSIFAGRAHGARCLCCHPSSIKGERDEKVLTLLLGSLATPVLADECALVIEGNDAMQFNQTAMSVPATCKEVTVTLNHTGKLPVANMGHNWVLANTADYQAIATAGMSAGVDHDYPPKDDPRILAHTKLVGAARAPALPSRPTAWRAGSTFFCSFPGHFALMKGSFKVGSAKDRVAAS